MSREMKNSGIPWIGEIPSEWSVLQLKRLKDEQHPYPIGDGDHGSIKPEDYIDEGIPYIRVQNMTWGGNLFLDNIAYISEEVNAKNLKSELHPRDILIAKTGATIGKTAIIPDNMPRANTTSSVAKVTISKQQWYKYIFYVLGSEVCITQMWLKAQQKSAQPGFNINELVDFILPLPSFSEQQKIASFLDRKCSEIDEMIALQEKIMEELKAYKQSVITETVTKGLNPNVPMKDSGIEWIGEIPEHWGVNKLKYCLSSKTNNLRVGPFGSSLSGDDIKENGDYWIYNQRTILDNNFISNNSFITADKYKELESFKVSPDDILITTRGSIGKIAIVPQNAPMGILHPCIIKFVIDKQILNTSLLKHLFNGSDFVLNQIKYQSNSTTIDVIYSYTLKNIKLPQIPIKEQEAIADYLDTKCTEIDNLISIKLSKIDSLKEYKKSIIYEYVTGKKEVE